MTAGRRKPALDAHARIERRERGLIKVNGANRRAGGELISGRSTKVERQANDNE
jgi:hypothetical protein